MKNPGPHATRGGPGACGKGKCFSKALPFFHEQKRVTDTDKIDND